MRQEQLTFQTLETIVTILRDETGDAAFNMRRVYDAVFNDPNWVETETVDIAIFVLKVVLLLGKL